MQQHLFANAGMNSDETYGNDPVAEAMRAYGPVPGLVTRTTQHRGDGTEFLRGPGQG